MASRPPRKFWAGRRSRSAADGETILDALARDGFPNLVRSVRYHRPRGPFCGTGDCTGCLVRLNGRVNVRACRRVVEEGDRVGDGNAWPSPSFDLLGVLDFLFPDGVDTLRGFRRPAWARGLYHAVNRRLAGYGAPPDPAPTGPAETPAERLQTEVAIVGAGTAGRAAAAAARAHGRSVVLIDRRTDVPPEPGVELRAGTTATFLSPPAGNGVWTLLSFREPEQGVLVRARSVVVATGSYDGPLLFGGNDRPGVVAAELALRWARDGRRSPLRGVLVVGGGRRASAVVERLGSTVVAVTAPADIGPEVTRAASERKIPLYPRSLVVRARGHGRVRAVELRGRSGGPRFSVRCDGVVLAHRRLPVAQLAFQAGAERAWNPSLEAYVPRTGADGVTTVTGLYVAGSAAGGAPDGSAESGTRAGASAAASASPAGAAATSPAAAPGPLAGYYRELLRERRAGKWVACSCEDVLLSEVERASARGYAGIEVVKRYTGLGTGLCQGRYCLPDALLLLSILEGRPPSEVGFITQRPPAVPTPLGALADLGDSISSEVIP